MTATLSVTAGTASQLTAGPDGGAGANGIQLLGDPGQNADSPGWTGRSAGDVGSTPGGGAGRGASLVEQGHVHARFGGIPVLVTAEMAAQIKAFREKQAS